MGILLDIHAHDLDYVLKIRKHKIKL